MSVDSMSKNGPKASRVPGWCRVIITGDRAWRIDEFAIQVVRKLAARHPGLVIVHGACTGVDDSFAKACTIERVAHEPHPAPWEDFGVPGALIRTRKNGDHYVANAGPLRNQAMVDLGADLCLAFHKFLPNSKGTRDCVDRALRAGIRTWLTDREGGNPVEQFLPKDYRRKEISHGKGQA